MAKFYLTRGNQMKIATTTFNSTPMTKEEQDFLIALRQVLYGN